MVRPVVRASFDRGGEHRNYNSLHPDGMAPNTGVLANQDELFADAAPPGGTGKVEAINVDSWPTGEVVIRRPDGSVYKRLPDYKGGTYVQEFQLPSEPGRYTVTMGGRNIGPLDIQNLSNSTPGGPQKGLSETAKSPDENDGVDPANYEGIVNADNEQGIALAPALRREGASLGPNGATVNPPDGRTVEVGAIQDEDEVARVIDGDNAGDVIDADQPATDDGSSGTSGQSGGFGGAAAVLAVLAVGYALTR